MGALMRKSLIACSLTLAPAPSAWAAGVDWKMYGTVSIDGGVVCFYEANGVVRASRTLHVWTKCLLQKDLDKIDLTKEDELGRKILNSTARKVIDGYIPPIALVEDATYDQAITVIQYEETAKLGYIEPHSQIFYELNCSERMLRELSLHVQANGKEGFSNKPSDWKYVAPETNGARLLTILCPRKDVASGGG
jgi:hypothetical protein